MPDTKDASAAARALIARRWGSQVMTRAAMTVIERADELPPDVRAEVHQATGQESGDG
jgi:hypothetical protein